MNYKNWLDGIFRYNLTAEEEAESIDGRSSSID